MHGWQLAHGPFELRPRGGINSTYVRGCDVDTVDSAARYRTAKAAPRVELMIKAGDAASAGTVLAPQAIYIRPKSAGMVM